MNRLWRITVVALLLLGLVLPSALATPAEMMPAAPAATGWAWDFTLVDSPGNVGGYNSMILDPAGYPHITYTDWDPAYDLKYAYQDGTGWHVEVANGSANHTGQYSAVGLDQTNGWPVASHLDWTNGDLLLAYQMNPTTRGGGGPDAPVWVSQVVDSAGYVGEYTALRVDSTNTIHIAYYDSSNRDLKYARGKAGGAWVVTTVDSAGEVGQYTALDLDAANRPHIAYYDNTNHDLRYAYFNGSFWTIQTVDSEGYVGLWNSLRVDVNNYPHIAYYDATNRDLKYAYLDVTGWHSAAVATTGDTGRYPSLVLDSAGRPHISYQLEVGPSEMHLSYIFQDARGWHSEVVDGSADITGGNSSLALSAAGLPRIAFYNATTGDLWYAQSCVRADWEWPGAGCSNSGIPFANWSRGDGAVTYQWAFGDGGTSTAPDPVYTYTLPGVYTVVLTATAGCGADVFTRTVVISGTPATGFTYGPVPACVAGPVQFTNTTVVSAPVSYQWGFGDGQFSTLENPLHTYTAAGTYNVGLLAVNDCGFDYSESPLSVHAGPQGAFSYTPPVPVVMEPVTFTAAATSTLPVAWAWSYGDGFTDTGQVVTHTYAAPGPYVVALTTTSPCGVQALTRTIAVCGPVEGVTFDWTPAAPVRGDPITFTATASGSLPLSYTWSFGDGGTAGGAVVSHTYAAGGVYTAAVTVTNACGQETLAHLVAVCGPLTGTTFTWSPPEPVAGEVVTFSATTSGTAPLTYTWAFGDGGTGTGAVVTHTFAAGDYTVTVTATNSCSTDQARHTVHVCAPPAGAAFSWVPDVPRIGEVVTFTALAEGDPPFTFTWTLGDGHAGAGSVVTHTYDAGGTYPVVLVAANPCGQQVVQHALHVCLPVAGAAFSWAPADPMAGERVTFSATVQSGDPPLTYAWAFGDGNTGTGAAVTHTYAVGGGYTVTVTATNACGQESVAQAVAVCGSPTGTGFTWSPADPVQGETVTFTAATSATAPLTFTWNLGDGHIGTGALVTHTYTVGGAYTVAVTAANACGAETATSVVPICGPATGAGFTYAPDYPGPGTAVTFTAAASGTVPLTFTWAFGDGGAGAGQVVTHTYAVTATYTVTLRAANRCGEATAQRAVAVAYCTAPQGLALVHPPLVAGRPARFTATVAVGSAPLTYAWDLGDSSPPLYGPSIITHTYAAAGNYTISVAVWNGCGMVGPAGFPVQVDHPTYLVYLPLMFKSYYPGDAFEPDDAPVQANLLGLASPQGHDFAPEGDVDWVYLNLTAGTTYRFQTRNLAGGADTRLFLYEPGAYDTPLASNDDWAAGNCGGTPPDPKASCFDYTPATGGRFELKVDQYESGAVWGRAVQYSVEATQR